jgi:hypothetical protein
MAAADAGESIEILNDDRIAFEALLAFGMAVWFLLS